MNFRTLFHRRMTALRGTLRGPGREGLEAGQPPIARTRRRRTAHHANSAGSEPAGKVSSGAKAVARVLLRK